jgi:hypothetical protein
MDRMKDSGSFDLGSNPGGVTKPLIFKYLSIIHPLIPTKMGKHNQLVEYISTYNIKQIISGSNFLRKIYYGQQIYGFKPEA